MVIWRQFVLLGKMFLRHLRFRRTEVVYSLSCSPSVNGCENGKVLGLWYLLETYEATSSEKNE